MRWTRLLTRNALALFGLAVVVSGAAAQVGGGTRPNEKLLLLTPRPTHGVDTAFVLELASQVRRRLSSQMRHKLTVYSDDQICRALEPSGYACDAILSDAESDLLAGFMQASAYTLGSLWRESATPWARFRFVDVTGNSGISGWITVRGTPGDEPRSFARTIVDSMENAITAAERSRECVDRRNRGDFADAMERAQRAFRIYPNHPAAAICAWYASEQLHQPLDSQVQYLRRAVRGDSVNARNWQRLGQLLRQAGDTAGAFDAFKQQTLLQPTDRALRVAVIAGAVSLGDFDQAVDLIDEWSARNPGDTAMVQLKLGTCVQGEMWRCALDTHAAIAERDTALSSDSTFYQQMIGYTQALGDDNARFTWTEKATERFPDSPSFLRARVVALSAAGMSDSLPVYYDRLLSLDSTDVRAAMGGAELLLGQMTIDSTTPIDTAALLKGAAYLSAATAATQDTSIMLRAALLHYNRGSELVRIQKLIPTAVDFLDKALAEDVRGVLTEQVNFFLGYGLLIQIFQFDPQVIEAKDCAMVEEEAGMIARALEAVRIGFNVAPGAAASFRERLEGMRDRIPQLRQAYSCQ